MTALELIRCVDPAFGARTPPNLLERALIVPVKTVRKALEWITRHL